MKLIPIFYAGIGLGLAIGIPAGWFLIGPILTQ